ncbi:permease prefix domain 1-containing protein [Oceanobacillus neutriphilus]|uniref:DUF1129 domain-containing protein n=1 Tax=Oceanobacillus neutriphilus TaxID=531815 RepID=A0ABQ2P1F6_9BACI|nr:permease prefix domain 1-containing protein [Oceanobacillus neutriphilus]GGP15905.1 hypothetical protein GCM10011346_45590 [Oceanobacillus neutriphilus]
MISRSSSIKDIPKSEEKEIIKQEIFQNLEEKVYDLMAQGKEEEDAVNKAIVEFGNIDEIKNELGVYRVNSDGDEKRIERAKIDLNFSVWGSILFIALMVFINLYYSPSTIWFVYPTFAILWWPALLYFIRSKRYFGLSVFGTFLTVVFFIVVSAISTPNIIWEVYPIFLILWWPLSMYFYGSNKRKSRNKRIRQV